MKAAYFAMAAALSVSVAAHAADEGEAQFKNNGCTACHQVENKGVGPSLKAIAAKYKGDKEAQAKLEKKVRSGGSGSFGAMPMPPTAAKVSDGAISAIVKWVLSH